MATRSSNGDKPVVKLTRLVSKFTEEFVNSNHSLNCYERMTEFWKKSQYCDVNLVIMNTQGTPTACVAAHRVVIASAIPFFAVMFSVQMKEETLKEVGLHGYESTAVKSLVEYAYTGKIEISDTNVKDILLTSQRFTLPDIVTYCIDFMTRQLSPANCIGVRDFTEAQNITELHTLAREYVIKNFTSVSKENEFLHLSLDKVAQLVRSDEILVDSEEDVYHAITRWLKHDRETRAEFADDLYEFVRFPITTQRFLETVASKNELLNSDKGRVYLKDGIDYHLNPAAVIFSNPKKTHARNCVQEIMCVVGGEVSKNCALSSFTLYNPIHREWREGPSLKYKRSRLALAIVQGELYAIGGYDLGYSLSVCEKYSASDNCWVEISPLNNARSGHAAITVGNRLFVMGGYTGSVHVHSVEIYNPSIDEWTSGPPMLEPRSELTAVYLDQYVYAIGGCNSTGDLRSVERFDLLNKKWEFVSSMNIPRTGGAAALLCKEILVSGGKGDSEIINTAETYDAETDLWEPIVSTMNNARAGFAMVSLDNAVYAIGGADLSGYLDSMEYYDAKELKWVESEKLSCCRFAPAAVTLSRKELNQ